MNNKILTVAAAALVLFTSCNKVKYLADVNVNVDLPYSNQVITPAVDSTIIPKGGKTFSFPKQELATNSADEMAQHSLSADKITSVQLKSFTQRIARVEDFDFVDNVQIFMSADGLSEVMIAQQKSVPDDTKAINLDCVSTDLKAYFLKSKVYIRLQGHFNSAPKSAQLTSAFKFNLTGSLTNSK